MTVEFLFLGLVLLAIGLVFFLTLRTATPPLPTFPSVRDTMLAMLPDQLDGPVYELGSGWGGLARTLARRYPAVLVRGFEVSILPWAVSRAILGIAGPDNLFLSSKDFHNADLADAALVVCYLTGPAMEKLRPKLEAELPPGRLGGVQYLRLQGLAGHRHPDRARHVPNPGLSVPDGLNHKGFVACCSHFAAAASMSGVISSRTRA